MGFLFLLGVVSVVACSVYADFESNPFVSGVKEGNLPQEVSIAFPSCVQAGTYYLPHATFCDLYYTCHGGHAMLGQCEDGLAFDLYKSCQVHHTVDCSKRPMLQHPKGNQKCPRMYGVFGDPRGCGYYYKCTNGTAISDRCPEGQVFEHSVKGCRLSTAKEIYDCQPQATYQLPVQQPIVTYMPADPTPVAPGPMVQEFPQGERKCLRLYGIFQDPRGCGYFYKCVNGTAFSDRCPEGQVFEHSIKGCRFGTEREIHDCQHQASYQPPAQQSIVAYMTEDHTTVAPAPVAPVFPSCVQAGSYYLPHELFCDLYYTCRDGHAMLGQCEDGLAFDLYKGCQLHHTVDCAKRPMLQFPKGNRKCPRRNGVFGDPRGCGYFYKCANGTAFSDRCPEGQVFEFSIKGCRLSTEKEIYDCQPHVTYQPPAQQSIATYMPAEPSPVAPVAPVLVPATTTVPGISGFECPRNDLYPYGEHSRHPYPGNCIQYIMCMRDKSVKVGSCDPGSVFNPRTGVCARPELVPGCY